MKSFWIALCLCLFSTLTTLIGAHAQSYEAIGNLSLVGVENLATSFGLPEVVYTPVHGVDAYRMTYSMPFLGENIDVSGAVFEPQGLAADCEAPVVIYMHGTVFERDDVPSFLNGEGQIGYLISALGFTVLMPDYVGLGIDDQHLHPYVHASSEAAAGFEMIEALFNTENPSPAPHGHDASQLFLSGYSQGGHAAMALHRELETNGSAYGIIASAPQSGPYDISGTQFPWIFDNPSYSNPSYLAYVALAWQSIYGNLYEDLGDWFLEPYDTLLPDLFDGQTSGGEINDVLPVLTEDFAQPGLLDVLLDAEGPFMAAALDNDVYDWAPNATTRLYYCTEDEQVYFENALVAQTWMTGLGASNVSAVDLGPYNHGTCAGFAILGAALWFQDLASFCTPASTAFQSQPKLQIHPNPVADVLRIEGLSPGTEWSISNGAGQLVATGHQNAISVHAWPEGLYFIYAKSGEILRPRPFLVQH